MISKSCLCVCCCGVRNVNSLKDNPGDHNYQSDDMQLHLSRHIKSALIQEKETNGLQIGLLQHGIRHIPNARSFPQ